MFHVTVATITTPPDGSLDDEAQRLVQLVQALYGTELAIVAGDRALTERPTQHTIALGCLADNPFVEALYQRYTILVDRWYPGTGGSVVQTLTAPFRFGEHVLLLGGSDVEGVRRATRRFVEQLESSPDGVVAWQLHVELGDAHLPLPEDRLDHLGGAASPVLIPESVTPATPYSSGFTGGSARDHLLRLGMYGPHADNLHLSRSSQLGLRYLYTGRLEDAAEYRRALLEEVQSGVVAKLYHYKSVRMLQLWPQLSGCPVFDDDERGEITRAIRTYLLEESGIANTDLIREASAESGIFSRHIACEALNLWAGADWLWRLTEDSRWLDDRRVADDFFESQAGTDVPLTGLTEGYASYLDIFLEWMLLSCPDRIAEDPHIRLWAERVTGLCTNTGQLVLGPQTDESRYPYHVLRRLAHLLDDGRYLFVANRRERQVRRGMDRVMQFSAGQAYAGDVSACEPGDAIGLTCYPMNERLRRWQAPSIGTGAGFDRAVARSGWSAEDDYLMVVGVRSGAKCLPNVGTIAAYERFGQRLITSDAVSLFPACASPWRHSGVTVNVGGLGAGMVEGARLLVDEEVCGGRLFSYRISDDLCRRDRLLFWMPAAYVLVVDRVAVETDEIFTLGVNWRCAGQVIGVEDGLATLDTNSEKGRFYVQVSPGLSLDVETEEYPALGAPPGAPANVGVMLHATIDRKGGAGEVEVATLLHAVSDAEGPRYRLRGGEEGWSVEGPDGTLGFGRGQVEGVMSIELRPQAGMTNQSRSAPSAPSSSSSQADASLPTRWGIDLPGPVSTWAQAADGSALAVGTDRGDVLVFDSEGAQQWTTKGNAAVTALSFHGGDLFVGSHSGEVCRFGADGAALWRHQCQFREERSFWPWWFLETATVGAIAVGCDPAGDQEIVAAGTGSTNLNFLDARSGALLADVVSPYGLPDRIRAHVPTGGDELRFLSGHSWLSCGSTVRAWAAPPDAQERIVYHRSVDPMGRTMDQWDTCGVVDFHVGPLVNGGPDRVVVLRHGAVNQMTVYDEMTGDPLWDAGLGGAPVALAVVRGDSETSVRCYVAEQFGWLVEFDGTGKRVSATRIASNLSDMHVSADGRLFVWSAEALHIVNRGRMQDRYTLAENTLGWYAHPSGPGLLCLSRQRLMLVELL